MILLDGGAGKDTVSMARRAVDTLRGSEGDDTLLGGAKNDILDGGRGTIFSRAALLRIPRSI